MEKIRFATIGTNITDTFLRAAREVPEFQLAAVFSRSEERAREKRLLLMEAMMTTEFPNFFQIQDNLSKLGRIRRYVANFGAYSVRYDDYKAGKQVNTFRQDLCNGAMLDMGVYCVAPMVALFGKPQEIKAFGVVLDSGVDGQSTVICRYPGMEAVNLVTKIADSFLPSEIAGEEGTMYLDHIQRLQVMEVLDEVRKQTGVSYACDIEEQRL